MKKIIYSQFDKNKIKDLQPVVFTGKIVEIYTETESEKAVDFLLSHEIVGFDTETKPSFRKGKTNKVAILQASTAEVCFLFRLNQLGINQHIKRLLESVKVKLIGLSIKDDIAALSKRCAFVPGNIIDLQHFVSLIGVKDLSLQKIYANIFGLKISKRQRLSNWESEVLNEHQKQYAAIDAWACVNLYTEICRLKETGNYQLIENLKEDPDESNFSND